MNAEQWKGRQRAYSQQREKARLDVIIGLKLIMISIETECFTCVMHITYFSQLHLIETVQSYNEIFFKKKTHQICRTMHNYLVNRC